MNDRKTIAAENRAEELLLELIEERLSRARPEKLSIEEKHGWEPVEEAHYKGYEMGWDDAIQCLSEIVVNHIEGLRFR